MVAHKARKLWIWKDSVLPFLALGKIHNSEVALFFSKAFINLSKTQENSKLLFSVSDKKISHNSESDERLCKKCLRFYSMKYVQWLYKYYKNLTAGFNFWFFYILLPLRIVQTIEMNRVC